MIDKSLESKTELKMEVVFYKQNGKIRAAQRFGVTRSKVDPELSDSTVLNRLKRCLHRSRILDATLRGQKAGNYRQWYTPVLNQPSGSNFKFACERASF